MRFTLELIGITEALAGKEADQAQLAPRAGVGIHLILSLHASKVEIFALVVDSKVSSLLQLEELRANRSAPPSDLASSGPQNLTALAPRLWSVSLSESGHAFYLCR